MTGMLDAHGSYTDLQTHTGFDFWLDVVPANTATGLVLFHALSLSRTTAGRVGDGGSYVDVRNQIDVPPSHAIYSMRDDPDLDSTANDGGVVVGFAVTARLEERTATSCRSASRAAWAPGRRSCRRSTGSCYSTAATRARRRPGGSSTGRSRS